MLPNSSWPHYDKNTISKVSNCLKIGNVNYHTGNNCKKFEKLFSKKIGIKHCLTVSNGTVALDLAIRVLGLKKRDYIILNDKEKLSNNALKNYQNLIKERQKGKPIAYITGKKEFWKFENCNSIKIAELL